MCNRCHFWKILMFFIYFEIFKNCVTFGKIELLFCLFIFWNLLICCHQLCFQNSVFAHQIPWKATVFPVLFEALVCLVFQSWIKHLGTCFHLQYFPFRWDGHQTERLSGMHAVSAAERAGPGPGGKSPGDSRRGARLQRALQQLRKAVSQWREMQRKATWLLLWLHLLCLCRAVLFKW